MKLKDSLLEFKWKTQGRQIVIITAAWRRRKEKINMEISLLVAGDHPGARVLRKSKELKSLIRKELKKHLYALASIQKKETEDRGKAMSL